MKLYNFLKIFIYAAFNIIVRDSKSDNIVCDFIHFGELSLIENCEEYFQCEINNILIEDKPSTIITIYIDISEKKEKKKTEEAVNNIIDWYVAKNNILFHISRPCNGFKADLEVKKNALEVARMSIPYYALYAIAITNKNYSKFYFTKNKTDTIDVYMEI